MFKDIICSLIFILLLDSTYAQEFDTAIVIKNLKLKLFSELEMGILEKPALENYLHMELFPLFLHSKGFKNMTFIKIRPQLLTVDTIQDAKIIKMYYTPTCLKDSNECYFVFAFNNINNKFFKLRGTKENQFRDLYISLQDDWTFWKPINKLNSNTIRKFISEFWIEGVDLNCLLKSLKNDNGGCLDYFSPALEIN